MLNFRMTLLIKCTMLRIPPGLLPDNDQNDYYYLHPNYG